MPEMKLTVCKGPGVATEAALGRVRQNGQSQADEQSQTAVGLLLRMRNLDSTLFLVFHKNFIK